jgi:type IV pilus modification protein PilV
MSSLNLRPVWNRTACGQGGFTLFEVMVAIVILAVGLLGLAGLQLLGLRGNTDSYTRSQAAILANDLGERMHINLAGVRVGGYVGLDITGAGLNCATPIVPNCITGPCSPRQLASFDAQQIFCEARGLFRVGRVRVACEAAAPPCDTPEEFEESVYRITLEWTEVGPEGSEVAQAIEIPLQP